MKTTVQRQHNKLECISSSVRPGYGNLPRIIGAKLALISLLIYGNYQALAQEDDWVHSSGSLSWFLSGNWSSGVPATGSEVYFLSNSVASVEGTTAATANDLYINTGGIKVGDVDSGTLTVANQIAVGTAGSSASLTLNYGTISANSINIGSGGTYSDTSAGVINFTGTNASFGVANGVTAVVNSTVMGTNGVIVKGLGTTVFANDNTYTGGTTISNGTLRLGNGGTSGSAIGDIANYGTLALNHSDEDDGSAYVFTNQVSGTGRLVQMGSGTTIITADNTYTGGTLITNGTLQVGDGSSPGSLGTGGITNNSELVYNLNTDVVLSNKISGTGNFTQAGSNTVIFTANNTYSGTTTINTNSALQVGNGGIIGAIGGTNNVYDNGVLVFDRSDSLVVSNQISGMGSLIQSNGTVILTANNSYSGTTTINTNSTLQVGNGGVTGSLGASNIYNYGMLVFDRTNRLVVSNTISGVGSLVQGGLGTNSILTLAATNTYSGGTSITNGGTIIAANNYALGTGDVNVENGTLKTGASSATNKIILNIGGNYTQSADGNLALTIGGTTSDAGTNNYDRLNIAGTASLDGTLWLIPTNNYLPQHNDMQTLVVASNGVTGTFASISNQISYSPLLNPQLTYNTNDVTLKWEQLSFMDYLVVSNDVKLTRNQTAVAKALDSIANSTATNDVKLINYLDYLNNLTNDLPTAFKQISPDQLTSMLVASLAVMDAQGNEFLKRANELHSDYAAMYSAQWRSRVRPSSIGNFDQYVHRTWDFYGDIPANFASVHGDENADGYDISGAGLTIGADRRLSQQLYAGFSLGYANSSAGLDNGGSMNMNNFNGMVYGTWFEQGWHLEGMVGGDINLYDTEREIIGGAAKGNDVGFGYTGLIGGGYDWELGPWKLGPQLSLQYMSAYINEFTESGSLSPLQIQSQSDDALHSQLGVNVCYRYLIGRWTYINPEFSLGWRHDFLDGSLPLSAKFASGEGDTFTVYSPKLGSDSAVASLGISIQWLPSFNSYLNLTFQMGRSGYDSQNISAGVRFSF